MSVAEWLEEPSKGVVRTVRAPQIQMAQLVEQVLKEGGIAAIEAGTGTGKSFAYSIPALLSGGRVIVSTAKKTLQTQLYMKDLPLLAQKVKTVPYALLKGKSNYVCKLRLAEFSENPESDRYSSNQISKFMEWAERHPIGDLGLFDNPDGEYLPFEHHVRVTECARLRCPHVSDCGYMRNKSLAGRAKLLVVNHAMLAYDLSVGGGKMLGEYDALIIDEAHQAPRYFREAFTYRLHPKQPNTLQKLLANDPRVMFPPDLENIYQAIFNTLPTTPGRLTLNADLEYLIGDLQACLVDLKRHFQEAGALPHDPIEEGVEVDARDLPEDRYDEHDARAHTKLSAAAGHVQSLLKMCTVLLDEQSADEKARSPYLIFTERKNFGRDDHFELQATPLEIGPLIAPGLLHIGKVVLTSATLATPAGFGYIAREFGFAESQLKHAVTLPSPFNYKMHSALYISQVAPRYEMLAQDREAYYAGMASEIHDLLCASKGGAFVLCASRADMQALLTLLRRETGPYCVEMQSSNIDRDLAWFKTNSQSVLLGVKSLWEGVDVPGLHLRLVIIPRLPFPNRGDVVLTARKEAWVARRVRQGDQQRGAEIKAFTEFDLQEALMDLKQGGGRLIRTETDRGIVALLDSRAVGSNKNYSGLVRAAFPHPYTYNKAQALQFLQILGQQAATAS